MSIENVGIRELSFEEMEQVSGGKPSDVSKPLEKAILVAAAVVEGAADLVTAGFGKISPDPRWTSYPDFAKVSRCKGLRLRFASWSGFKFEGRLSIWRWGRLSAFWRRIVNR